MKDNVRRIFKEKAFLALSIVLAEQLSSFRILWVCDRTEREKVRRHLSPPFTDFDVKDQSLIYNKRCERLLSLILY